MLSIGKISLDGESYYVSAVAAGVDEYYRGVGEAPGRWTGAAADPLGLAGEVQADDLHAIWSGLDPATGERLGRLAGRTVAGFDLCFRAPKSVSLLAGLGPADVAGQVRDAHEAAVDAAFGYVEEQAARSRTGKNGMTPIPVQGLVAAAFRHRTSRAGDPHLHTHVLVANLAEGDDGVWRTLDARLLFQYAATAGYLYEAQLRDELTRRLGVEWNPVEHGIADLAGIDDAVLVHFSDRRQEIEEHLDEVGFHSARAAEIATLATRAPKELALDAGSMRDVWEAKAAAIGWDPASLAAPGQVIGRVAAHSVGVDRDELFAELLSPGGLTERASSFARRDVLRAIAARVPAGAPVAQIESWADELEACPDLVRLAAGDGPGLLGSTVIRRRDGRIIAAGIDEGRWSTAALVGLELRLVERALARRDEGAALVEEDVLDEVLARRSTLSGEQITMVVELTRAGHGLDVVCAAAGTGKTFTLDAAREAWQRSGYTVRGAALAGQAAQELEAAAGVASSTLALLEIELAAGRVRFDDRTILLIDEAAMAGTRTLAAVLDQADRAGTKVVLIGDPGQLPAIDAGGVLAGLAQRFEPIELRENRRQRAEWERTALAELRAGDVGVAYAAYARHGRLVEAPSAGEVRRAMVADWWSYRLAGDSVAMLAVRRSDVDDLNGRARAYRVRHGDLTGPELVIDDRPYQAGDDIICLRNNRALSICNGTRGTITSVDPDQRTITMAVGDRSVTLPAAYLEAGHINHGYAATIHKAQGATFDRALVLGTDDLYRERGYVGLSRGRESNHLYLVGATLADDAAGHGPPPSPGDPAEAVQWALTIDTPDRMAIDTGEPLAFWPVEDLITEQQRLRALLASGPPDRTADVGSLTDRRDELAAEIEPLAGRYNRLADRRLRGPATRAELRTLGQQLGDRTAALSRVTTELWAAHDDTARHHRFQTEHVADAVRLDAVDVEVDRQIAARVERHSVDPPGDFVRVLGRVPTDPAARAAWKRGALLLETHHLGADADPSQQRRESILGTPTEALEMRARLEALNHQPTRRDPVSVDLDFGLGL